MRASASIRGQDPSRYRREAVAAQNDLVAVEQERARAPIPQLHRLGTVPAELDEHGSLVELSWDGAEPLELGDGSTRSFLLDGDEVVMRGDGLAPVSGRILPADGSVGAR